MANIFIDCGSNLGQGLRQIALIHHMDASWIVETFEPNPYLIKDLTANLSVLPLNITIHNKAVWDEDGEVSFSVMLEESEGSSVEKLMAVAECADQQSGSFRKHDHIITVPSVDISTVLKAYTKEDRIVVKLDIEGSEFCVLRKMLADDTMDLVNELYIEWHTKYINGESKETEAALIQQISARGVQIHGWH